MFPQFSRRQLLQSASTGFGYMAFAGLAAEQAHAATNHPLAPKTGHHPARAKRVIFLFMHGGPSQVDTFDYKPALAKYDGGDLPGELAKGTSGGTGRKLMKSPWKFQQHGECGHWMSSLFPHVAKHVDDLCFLSGLHTDGQSHGQAVLQLHTGAQLLTRPSVGSWLVYGLGSENKNLPGFVTICPTRGHGGVLNYGNAFLPAVYQGTSVGSAGTPASSATIKNIVNTDVPPDVQRKQLDFLQSLNATHRKHIGDDHRIDGVMESFELAFRMQSAVPDVCDLAGESTETLKMYGIGEKPTDDFGRQCLMARRFAEAGVRYIQVSHSFKWDQHGNLKQHEKNALEVDQPIAALLEDLKARGLLEDTLVLWGGEFGRTPVAQGKDGRDHNPVGFTMWMAGGGVKSGLTYGETDEFGYFAVKEKMHMHDLHATILWLMGIDHERLTYRYAGRDFRLTDVFGRVATEIFA
ncbi:MAG: DUF1501 domain-containing protein [Bacteroidales bacterium]|nr:DUF1501 domain-containing protein [Bacteroidales bacterium]